MTTSPESLTDLARGLMSHGGWAPAADLVGLLAPHVPEETAQREYARNVSVGMREIGDPAERLEYGRRRAAGECFARLARNGQIEATGSGDTRQYRAKPMGLLDDDAKRKPVLKALPLESIVFDPALQQRAGGLTDPKTVDEYLDILRDGAAFDPIDVFEVTDRGNAPYCVHGFHRGETYRRDNRGSIECVVRTGTWLEALLFSCGANARNPKQRTDADKQRAISTVLDSPALLERVLAGAKDEGGVHRAIAKACGVSKGVVYTALDKRGLHVPRGSVRIAPKPKGKETPTPAPYRPENEKPPTGPQREPSPAPGEESEPRATEPATRPPAAPPPDESPADRTARLAREEFARAGPLFAAALKDGRRFYESLRAALGTGLPAKWLQDCQSADGPLFAIDNAKGEWRSDALELLLLALFRRTPVAVCQGCRGDGAGCRACKGRGHVPRSAALLPSAGDVGDLFRDVELSKDAA